MRAAVALILAIATFFAMDYGLQRLGETVGIQSAIRYSEPIVREAYDQVYEDFGGTTTFGYAVAAFSAVISVWVAKAVASGSVWKQAFSVVGRRYWLAWLFSTVAVVLLMAVTNLVFSNVRFPFKGQVWIISEFLGLAGITLVAVRWARASKQENEA